MPSHKTPADALREAGFVKCPGWWVTRDQLDVIERMARGNLETVNRIKAEAEKAAGFPTAQHPPLNPD